jgi:hypothetical protein
MEVLVKKSHCKDISQADSKKTSWYCHTSFSYQEPQKSNLKIKYGQESALKKYKPVENSALSELKCSNLHKLIQILCMLLQISLPKSSFVPEWRLSKSTEFLLKR